tara:strand:+ start:469 stop:1335 length:867 start_codon:yes stop_codon:yes gene_type:complete
MAAISAGTAALISAGVSAAGAVGGAAIKAGSARRAQKNANKRAKKHRQAIKNIEMKRQKVINPFAGVTDLSSMVTDLSGMAQDLSGKITDVSGNLKNPYANLGVATKSAEIQMEQSDIALANTLDTLRSTGSSAGGATALAQAALQSKQDVAAGLEQQEASNEKLRAQGEASLQQMKMQEAQRVQGLQLNEAQRVQGLQMGEALRVQDAKRQEAMRMQEVEARGKEFVYREQENRDIQQLNRQQALLTGQEARHAQATTAKAGAWSGAVGGITDFVGTGIEGNWGRGW